MILTNGALRTLDRKAMTLPYREERLLRRVDHALRRSDPDLASLLSIFARLNAAEAMPARERLRPQPSWAWRGLLWPVDFLAIADRSVFTDHLVVDDVTTAMEFFVLAKCELAVKVRVRDLEAGEIIYIGPADAAPGLDQAAPEAGVTNIKTRCNTQPGAWTT